MMRVPLERGHPKLSYGVELSRKYSMGCGTIYNYYLNLGPQITDTKCNI
jgi:hypothetical protein